MRRLAIFSLFSTFLFQVSAQTAQRPFLGNHGIEFIENLGQIMDMSGHVRPDVLFVGDANLGAHIFLQKNKVSYVYEERKPHYEPKEHSDAENRAFEDKYSKKALNGLRVDMEFLEANPNPSIIEEDPFSGLRTYYSASSPDGINKVKSFGKITLKDIYPKTNVVYYGGSKEGLKYDFVVNPGGNPSAIHLRYSGITEMKLV